MVPVYVGNRSWCTVHKRNMVTAFVQQCSSHGHQQLRLSGDADAVVTVCFVHRHDTQAYTCKYHDGYSVPNIVTSEWIIYTTMLLLRFCYKGVEFVIYRFELNVEFTLVHSAGYNDRVVVNERHVSSPGKQIGRAHV